MKSLILSRKGLVMLVLTVLIAIASKLGTLEEAGLSLYDRMRVLTAGPESPVTVIALDAKSIAKLGKYPVPVDTHLRLIENLVNTGATVIGYVGFPMLDSLSAGNAGQLTSPSGSGLGIDRLAGVLRDSGRVVAGVPFTHQSSQDGASGKLPSYLIQDSLPNDVSMDAPSAHPAYPLPANPEGPATVYSGVMFPHEPGSTVRTVPLFFESNGLLVPSIITQMYLKASGLHLSDIVINDTDVMIGDKEISADATLSVWPYLHTIANTDQLEVISYHDVLHGAATPRAIRDRVVLLGLTAPGIAQELNVPGALSSPPVMLVAGALTSMLDNHTVAVPASWRLVNYLLLIIIALLLLWQFNKSLMTRVLLMATVVMSMLFFEFVMLSWFSVWLDMYPPMLLSVAGFIVTVLMHGGAASPEKSTAMSGEVHRRIGLASQKRGELDAAFESFRKCPLDNSIMVMLFYLAQDFENEGRYDRAVAVYQYMESFNPHFKDLQDRLEKARMMEDTVMIDEKKIGPQVSTAITDVDSSEDFPEETDGQRYLGRYLVKQEIGKGAMGMVYQGSDPKINRTVAIKTLNLKREFDDDEQENVLGRFFHEAEAAGRLHHPHIVTIYDAGEHDDLAYIAMEYLTGSDLRVYTKKGTLLPPLTVVKIGMKLAGALAYAHSRDIIHRDIKAANVMYDPSSGQLKITDFGIARLTDSRRTKTGMVLGTPSSMSPEQLRGKKLDGRTDLYSLGVLMFQLLTGRLPYKAESLTQLMYKITNEPTPDLFVLRPELAENGACIKEIVEKLLQKEADDRYQDGKKLARDLLACAKKLSVKKS